MTARTSIDLEDVVASHGPDDPARFLAIADHFLTAGDLPAAAAALDRAHGLLPDDPGLARQRAGILDALAVREHGLVWRYVPAGTFLMGSEHGDPDERPVHPRRLGAFWITEIPLTWADACRLLGFRAPPDGDPLEDGDLPGGEALSREESLDLHERRKLRLQYCETETLVAEGWHAHEGPGCGVRRRNNDAPFTYDRKPMIAASIEEAHLLARRLSTPELRVGLPSEAQWEKAARGGLVGRRYAWGDTPPDRGRCDFDRPTEFRLTDPRDLPPNGYGLHGMCGGVWEWTSDVYDALAYHRAAEGDPGGPWISLAGRSTAEVPAEDEVERVLRGGSWCDCAEAVTVSFRMGRLAAHSESPSIGLRLVREPR